MRASSIIIDVKRTGETTLRSRDGKPFSFDAAAPVLIAQRRFKKQFVPLETNGGKPIRRK